jgi:hypothetical protein
MMEGDGIVLPGTVLAGHGVAGGTPPHSPYPAGTISMQIPRFRELGLDLTGFHPATLNISTRPHRVRITNPAYHFDEVSWTAVHGPESFDFIHVVLLLETRRVEAWGYRPTADTKAGHPQPREVLEVIAPYLADVRREGEILLELDPNEVVVESPPGP